MEIDLQTIQSAITAALTSLLTTVTLFVPRLLNALILFLLGWLLARLASTIVERLLVRLRFDRLLERGGLEQVLVRADVHIRPSTVLARLIYWLLLLTFLLAAVDAIGLQTAAGAIRELVSYIPNLIGGVLVVIGGGLLARFFGQAAQTLAAGANLEFHQGLGSAVRYFLLALTFVLAAGQLGLDVSFLGGALANIVIVVIAVLGLTFALGGRDLVRNMLAGIYAKEIYEFGQLVRLQAFEGTLEAIGTFKATIATTEEMATVPNSLLINEVVTSRNNKEAASRELDTD
jgi:small-conductance mechanosensitive channel